jgi:hypothetical protein
MKSKLTSDLWSKSQLEQAKIDYLKPRSVGELVKWLQEIDHYDLITEASSLWPVDYSSLDHPLNVSNFSFEKIAKVSSIDLHRESAKVLEDLQNVTATNIQVLPYRENNKERQFLLKSGFDRETHSLGVTEENYPVLHELSKKFKFIKFSSAIQYQPPGGILPRHTDFLTGMWDQFSTGENNFVNMLFDPITKSPKGYFGIRVMIALTDWVPGQVFGFQDDYWTNWKLGDVITFDWAHARHFTANASYAPRAYLKVSGIVDKHHWIFDNINHKKITEL